MASYHACVASLHVAVSFLLLSLLCVHEAVGCNAAALTECELPPEGDWIVDHHAPTAPGNDTLVVQFRSVFNLKRNAIPNGYEGFGSGLTTVSESPLSPLYTASTYGFLGFFDDVTCMMTGVFYDFSTPMAEPTLWRYDGNTLSGPYITTEDGMPLFTTSSYHVLNRVPTTEPPISP